MVAAVAEAPALEAEEEGGQAHHHRLRTGTSSELSNQVIGS